MCRWLCCCLALGLLAEGLVSARSNGVWLAQQEQPEPKPMVWPKKGTKPKPKPPAQKPGPGGKKNPPRKGPGKGKSVAPGKGVKDAKEASPPTQPTTPGKNTEKGSDGKALVEEPPEVGPIPEETTSHSPATPGKPAIPASNTKGMPSQGTPSATTSESTSPATNNTSTNKESGNVPVPADAAEIPPPSKDQGLAAGNEQKVQAVPSTSSDTKSTGEAPGAAAQIDQQNIAPVQSDPLFRMSLTGGVLLLRSMRIDPSVMLMCDFDVGRFLGWHGLYVGLEADSYMGTSLFGTSYLMFDGLLGFRGRFGWPTIKILAGLGAGIRYMVLMGETTGTSENPEIGFGGEASAGVEFDLNSWLFVVVRASGRYMKEPLAPRFQFSSVFGAGVGFSF